MPFDFDFAAGSRELLMSLVDQTRSFLQTLVFGERPYDYQVTFIEGVREDIALAVEAAEPDFREARAAAEFMREERFILAGLWDIPLIAKLKVLVARSRRFLQGAAGSFGYIIFQLNSLFESFFAATGTSEAIKELKDLISNGVDELRRPDGAY